MKMFSSALIDLHWWYLLCPGEKCFVLFHEIYYSAFALRVQRSIGLLAENCIFDHFYTTQRIARTNAIVECWTTIKFWNKSLLAFYTRLLPFCFCGRNSAHKTDHYVNQKQQKSVKKYQNTIIEIIKRRCGSSVVLLPFSNKDQKK